VLVDVFGDDTEDYYRELQALKGVGLQRMDFVD
jgi:hypothetical protein